MRNIQTSGPYLSISEIHWALEPSPPLFTDASPPWLKGVSFSEQGPFLSLSVKDLRWCYTNFKSNCFLSQEFYLFFLKKRIHRVTTNFTIKYNWLVFIWGSSSNFNEHMNHLWILLYADSESLGLRTFVTYWTVILSSKGPGWLLSFSLLCISHLWLCLLPLLERVRSSLSCLSKHWLLNFLASVHSFPLIIRIIWREIRP